jgi:2-dehydropantoate 2-reductase
VQHKTFWSVEKRGRFTMNIAILGAGAVGGLLAARLIVSGQSVTVIDRGAHLEKIREDGICLISPDESVIFARPTRVVTSCQEAGQHDLVFLAVKANQLEDLAEELPALFDVNTIVVTLQNGLPWWYFKNLLGPYKDYRFKSIDREGRLVEAISYSRILGSVAFPSGEVIAPGVIRHIEGNRFPIGELDGSITDRATQVSALLNAAELKSTVLRDIRSQIWLKLWGNLSFNPISALTQSTLISLCQEPTTRALAATMMAEAKVVGEKLGVRFRISIYARIDGGERTGEHKTSTLQDIELGRRIEVNALLGAVLELGEMLNVNMPTIKMAYALLKLLDKTLEVKSSKLVLQPILNS